MMMRRAWGGKKDADRKGCLSVDGVRFEFESAILTHRGIYTSRLLLLAVRPCRRVTRTWSSPVVSMRAEVTRYRCDEKGRDERERESENRAVVFESSQPGPIRAGPTSVSPRHHRSKSIPLSFALIVSISSHRPANNPPAWTPDKAGDYCGNSQSYRNRYISRATSVCIPRILTHGHHEKGVEVDQEPARGEEP
jgi:hypothetical protein